MSKHTPGPWSKAEARTEGFVITSRNELIVHSIDEYGYYGPIKSSANANLIAAAPDLLECLETIKQRMQDPRGQWLYEIETMIDSAIAKTKGESCAPS